jgi:hypothetical protein
MTAWSQIISDFSKPIAQPKRARTFTIEKRCSKCGEVKPRDEFYTRVDHSPGALMSRCKACVNASQAKRRESAKKAEANLKARVAERNSKPAATFDWPDDET